MPTSIPANYEEKTTNQGPSNSPQIATNSPQIAVQFHKKINIAATMEEDKKTKEAPTPPWRIIVKPLHPNEPPPPPSGEANAKPKLDSKIGAPGTRRPRPRGGKQLNRFWHSALAGAKAKGPATEWLFRRNFPKPGEHDLHKRWLQWLREEYICPSADDFKDDVWQMLIPGEWRKAAYQKLGSMEEFYALKSLGGAKRARHARW